MVKIEIQFRINNTQKSIIENLKYDKKQFSQTRVTNLYILTKKHSNKKTDL